MCFMNIQYENWSLKCTRKVCSLNLIKLKSHTFWKTYLKIRMVKFCDKKSYHSRCGVDLYTSKYTVFQLEPKRSIKSPAGHSKDQRQRNRPQQVLRAERAWYRHQKLKLNAQGYKARLGRNKTLRFQTSKRTEICANKVDS